MDRIGVCLAGLALAACTTFAFPAPTGTAGDGGSDASVAPEAEASTDAGVLSPLLDPTTAARVCTLTFQCPRLAQAIEASLVVPVATPATPLNFSGCMDWLAGSIDPGRVGLATLRQVLDQIATAADCDAAYQATPVHPVDAGATCAASSCAGASLETCSASAGAFTTACGPPLFDQPGACVAETTGAACISAGACTAGLSCRGSALIDCYKGGASFTAYDCTLSGRSCVNAGAADCVTKGKLAAPCPSRLPDDRCDGASVVHCAGGLLAQTEFDCSAVDRSCSLASGQARCVGSDDACTPFDANGKVNACSGSVISLCVAGQRTSFDCASIGAQCRAADPTHTAHCG